MKQVLAGPVQGHCPGKGCPGHSAGLQEPGALHTCLCISIADLVLYCVFPLDTLSKVWVMKVGWFAQVIEGMGREVWTCCSALNSSPLPCPDFYTVLLRAAELHTVHTCQTPAHCSLDERAKSAQAATDPPALVTCSGSL